MKQALGQTWGDEAFGTIGLLPHGCHVPMVTGPGPGLENGAHEIVEKLPRMQSRNVKQQKEFDLPTPRASGTASPPRPPNATKRYETGMKPPCTWQQDQDGKARA